jgi:RimJ/RimL family protein N-acetyltransferase
MSDKLHLPTEQPGTTIRTLSDEEFLAMHRVLFPDAAFEDRHLLLVRDITLSGFPGGLVLGILHQEEIVGEVELSPYQDRPYMAAVGGEVAKGHRRRGHYTAAIRALARYGFEELGLNVIMTKVARGNRIAQASARKAGFFSFGGMEDDRILLAFDRSRLNRPS